MTKANRVAAGLVFAVAAAALAVCSWRMASAQGSSAEPQTQSWNSAYVAVTSVNTTVSIPKGQYTVRFINMNNDSYQSANRMVIDITDGDGVAVSAGTSADYTDQIVLEPGESIMVESHYIRNKRFGVVCAAGETANLYWMTIHFGTGIQ